MPLKYLFLFIFIAPEYIRINYKEYNEVYN